MEKRCEYGECAFGGWELALIIGIASGKSGAPAAQYSTLTEGRPTRERERENTSEPAILKCVLLSNIIHFALPHAYVSISLTFFENRDGVRGYEGVVVVTGNINMKVIRRQMGSRKTVGEVKCEVANTTEIIQWHNFVKITKS